MSEFKLKHRKRMVNETIDVMKEFCHIDSNFSHKKESLGLKSQLL